MTKLLLVLLLAVVATVRTAQAAATDGWTLKVEDDRVIPGQKWFYAWYFDPAGNGAINVTCMTPKNLSVSVLYRPSDRRKGTANVTYRFDKSPQQTAVWNASGFSMGPADNPQSVSFVQNMLKSQTVVIQMDQGKPYAFPMKGSREILKQTLTACGAS